MQIQKLKNGKIMIIILPQQKRRWRWILRTAGDIIGSNDDQNTTSRAALKTCNEVLAAIDGYPL